MRQKTAEDHRDTFGNLRQQILHVRILDLLPEIGITHFDGADDIDRPLGVGEKGRAQHQMATGRLGAVLHIPLALVMPIDEYIVIGVSYKPERQPYSEQSLVVKFVKYP